MRNCLVVIMCALVFTGCGGGGGKSGPGGGGGPPPITSETFSVGAGQAIERTVGNVEISIPAGTFSQNASITVELRPVTLRPANPTVGIVGSEVTVTPSVVPTGPISIMQNGGLSRSATPSYLSISWIGGKWRKVSEAVGAFGQIRAVINPSWFVVNGSMRVLLSAFDTSYDTNMQLVCLAGDPYNWDDDVAILVHGILSDENAMRPLGERLVASGRYKTAWALHYDWRLPTDYVASWLGYVLSAGNTIDLFGHSRGVLICRYTLEVLQRRPKTFVNRAVLICGPNKGSKLDTEVELLTALQEDFLNDENAVGFPVVDTPAVQELTAESSVVQALNGHGCNSNLGIKYYMFAAESDSAVSVDSALARGINLECFTGFSVVRQTLWGGHSTLISDPGGISNMLSFL